MNKENNLPTLAYERQDDTNEEIRSSPNSSKTLRRSFRPTNSSSSDFENYVRHEFTSLRANIEQLNRTFCELNARLKQVSKNDDLNNREISTAFPIATVKDLEELEAKILDEKDRYIELFKKLVGNGGIEKNFKNFISPKVAVEYNFDGTSGKKSFKSLKAINMSLYSAVKKDFPSYTLYEKSIRLGFKRMKNSFFKKNAAQRKEATPRPHLQEENESNNADIYMQTASF